METGDAVAVGSAFHLVKGIAVMLYPFVPKFAADVLQTMEIGAPKWEEIDSPDGGREITERRVLLERIEIAQVKSRIEGVGKGERRVPFEEFERLDLRIGEIRAAVPIPGTDRLYRLTIDVGGDLRTSVAGLRREYPHDALIGRRVAVVANLAPTTIKGVKSECMLLAAKGMKSPSFLGQGCPSGDANRLALLKREIGIAKISFD